MNKTTSIFCAVVGVGYLGKFHADKYAALENAKLVAVCDFDSKTATTIAAKHNVPAYTAYRELIGEVNAVSIATPTTTHFEIARFFLEHGVHVLLEKPIAVTIKEAKTLEKLAAKKQLVLTIGHLERLNSVFLELQKRSQKPLFIEVRRAGPFKNRATDVSVIMDLMIHDIDLALTLAKAPVKTVRANGKKLFTNTIDFATAEIIFQNGCRANLTASRITPAPFAERKISIIDETGHYCADLNAKTITISKKPSDRPLPIAETELITENLILQKNDALLDEVSAFVAAIKNGTAPITSAKEATEALAVALKIEKMCFDAK